MPSQLIQAVGGCVGGLLVSLGLIRWVAPMGWMDRPDRDRKHHARPTARTGGLALWLILIVTQISGLCPFAFDLPDWVAIHLMALTGLLDDRFNLRPRYKAVVGLAAAVLLAFHSVDATVLAKSQVTFLGLDLPAHPAVLVPLLSLWFWGVPQAFNLIDGINGLSMGFSLLLLGVLGWNLGAQPGILYGALVGVLALNFPRARHFLGDCGALMLGTSFAILGVMAFGSRNPNLMLWVFAYPILDVCLVVGIRRWKGQPLGQADRSHLHHWMMDRVGGRSWLATPLLLVLAALPMIQATRIPGSQVLSSLGLLVLGVVVLKAFKDRITTPEGETGRVRVNREIPFLAPVPEKTPSGFHNSY